MLDREIFLNQFKEERLEIVRLRDEEKWTWRKIAEHYGVSQTAVMNRYNREKLWNSQKNRNSS